jgi:hypothetical protein
MMCAGSRFDSSGWVLGLSDDVCSIQGGLGMLREWTTTRISLLDIAAEELTSVSDVD